MLRCIFCPNELTPATKPEHILLNALGGRKATRRAICSDCNNVFGRTIDDALTEQVEEIRNMLRLESGTGKPPPMLRGVRAGEDIVNFRNDGTPEIVGKPPFAVDKREDGSVAVRIEAKSEEELHRLIPHIAAQIGCSDDELRASLLRGEASFSSQRPGTVHFRLSFGGPQALRSVTKACLVLWSTLVGNDEVRSDAYAAARDFVLGGGEAFNRDRIRLDSRYLPNVTELKARFGHLFNLIYVRSDEAGRVVGHFTLYNAIGWQVVLAEADGTPDMSVGLASNPLDPTVWSDTIAAEVDVPMNWLRSPAIDDEFARSQERFGAIARQHFDRGMDQELERIVLETLQRHGVRDGDRVPDDAQQVAFAEISERAAHLICNVPYERAYTPEEVADLLKRKR